MPTRRPNTVPSSAGLAAILSRHRVLAALLVLDVATKVAAWTLLPEGRIVDAAPGFRLLLAVNEWGVLGGPVGIGRVVANPAYTLLLAAGLAMLAAIVWRLGRTGASFSLRLAIGGGAFAAVAVLAELGAAPLSRFEAPAEWVVASIRASVLLLTVSLYAASRDPLPRAAFTLLAAGALANAFSYAYPPFRVVDFLVVPLAPFVPLLGDAAARAASDSIGVINLADVYLFLFPPACLLWPLLRLAARWRRER